MLIRTTQEAIIHGRFNSKMLLKIVKNIIKQKVELINFQSKICKSGHRIVWFSGDEEWNQ